MVVWEWQGFVDDQRVFLGVNAVVWQAGLPGEKAIA
ncbi:MAG: hypothetical protein ACJARE_001898 [Paracoccaceae bacterium]